MAQLISQISLTGTASLTLAFLWDELFCTANDPIKTAAGGFILRIVFFKVIDFTHQPSPWMGDFSQYAAHPINGNYRKIPFFMLKVLTAQKKVYILSDSSVDPVNCVMASALH